MSYLHSIEMSFGRTNCISWSVLDIYEDNKQKSMRQKNMDSLAIEIYKCQAGLARFNTTDHE